MDQSLEDAGEPFDCLLADVITSMEVLTVLAIAVVFVPPAGPGTRLASTSMRLF
jgi:hypothetical protein